MELKNGKIYDDSDFTCGGKHEIYDYTYSLSDDLEKNTRYNIYIYMDLWTNQWHKRYCER